MYSLHPLPTVVGRGVPTAPRRPCVQPSAQSRPGGGVRTPRPTLPVLLALAAAVLTLASSAWAAPTQQAYVKASHGETSDMLGQKVAISGNILVSGAINEDSNATGVNGNATNESATAAGAAYIFVRNGTNWSQEAYFKASNTDAQDFFGWSVGVSGDTVIVGAPQERSNATGVNGNQTNNSVQNAGAVYVFVREGTNGSQQAYLKASNTGGDFFGRAVAIDGNTIVVGARGEDSSSRSININQDDNSAPNAGAAYVFVRSGTNWSQQAYLKASNASANDFFGNAVAISGDTVVVSAHQEDSGATGVNGNQENEDQVNSGAAYVFVRDGTLWSQQAYLKASNPGYQDYFGWSVAVAGDTAVIGAEREGSKARGVNGDQLDDTAFAAGAAYVFMRSGGNWSQQAYLKASNADAGDFFGHSVDVFGDTVIVGAPSEDSAAMGVNGNETDNTLEGAGAAYLFVRVGTNWSQQAYLKSSNPLRSFADSVAISGHSAIVGETSDAGTVYVFTGAGVSPPLNLAPDGSGGYFIRFTGAPDVTYRLQRAASVAGPWDTIATLTAPASGQLEFHDAPPPPGQAFYRTVQP